MSNLAARFKEIQEQASTGYYLDRLYAIAEAAELMPSALAMLRTHKAFAEEHGYMPDWTRVLCEEISLIVISKARRDGVDPLDLAPVAWGLDIAALDTYGLVFLRSLTRELSEDNR